MPPQIFDVCPLCVETAPHTHFRGGGTWFQDGRFRLLMQRSTVGQDAAFFYAPVCDGVQEPALVALLALCIEANGMICN